MREAREDVKRNVKGLHELFALRLTPDDVLRGIGKGIIYG